MSALAQDRQPRGGARAQLRPVPSRPSVIGRTPFLLILASMLVLGMVGVLVLNTSLQSRAFEVRKLQRQANELAYLRADLESRSRRLATTEELARRATDLGMVPNPYPVYVVLPSGEVRGVPKPAGGGELPLVGYKSPAEVGAARAAATAPPPTPEPVAPAEPGDGAAPPDGGAPANVPAAPVNEAAPVNGAAPAPQTPPPAGTAPDAGTAPAGEPQ